MLMISQATTTLCDIQQRNVYAVADLRRESFGSSSRWPQSTRASPVQAKPKVGLLSRLIGLALARIVLSGVQSSPSVLAPLRAATSSLHVS